MHASTAKHRTKSKLNYSAFLKAFAACKHHMLGADSRNSALWLSSFDPDVSKIRFPVECYYLHAEYISTDRHKAIRMLAD